MKAVITISLTLLLFSCSTKGPSDDDYKIINATFHHLLMSRLPGQEIKFGYDNFILPDTEFTRKVKAEVKRKTYFTKNLIPINDTVFFHHAPIISEASIQGLKGSGFQKIAELFNQQKTSHMKLNMGLIKNTGIFSLRPLGINEQPSDFKIGDTVLTYSTIIYNRKKDKACFYFQNGCSGMCGYAKWVFVEKINGIWTIKETIGHWVA